MERVIFQFNLFKRFQWTLLYVAILTGCASAPSVRIPGATTQIAQAPLIQEEYVPPQQYIVDAPLYYDNQPGVAFYPIYIDTPGSCFCVLPMRYYGGVWLGVTGEVIYRGFFPYRIVEPHHRTVYLQRTLVVNGFSPHRGRFESVGGRLVVLPPVGTMHHQVVEQRRISRAPPEVPRGVNATGNVPVRREAGPAGQVPTPQTTHPRQGVQPSQHDAQPRQQPPHRDTSSSAPAQPNQPPNSEGRVVSPQQAQPSQQPAQKSAPCSDSDAKQRKCQR